MAHQKSVPRHKRLSRQARLQAAKHWVAQYPGTKILRAYCKHFGVDFECAFKELTLLGIPIDAQYIQQRRQSLLARIEHRRKRQETPCLEVEGSYNEWLWWFQSLGQDFAVYGEPRQDTSEPRDIFVEKSLDISDVFSLDPAEVVTATLIARKEL